MEMFCIWLSSMVAASYVWPLSTWNVANKAENLKFLFYFILINYNLNWSSYMWLVATILDRAALDFCFDNWVAYGATYWKKKRRL